MRSQRGGDGDDEASQAIEANLERARERERAVLEGVAEGGTRVGAISTNAIARTLKVCCSLVLAAACTAL